MATRKTKAPEVPESRMIDAYLAQGTGEIVQIPVSALVHDPSVFPTQAEAELARDWAYGVINGHDVIPVIPWVFARADGAYVPLSWVAK